METDPNTIPDAALVTDPNARTWGMLSHLLSLLGYFVAFGHVLPPLVIYLAKKDEHEFIRDQARESLNFQITVLLLAIVCGILVFFCIGIPLLIALVVYQLVMVIVASIQANDGKRFRYPFTLRLVT
jgi:uncharacterized Tic20 family protein